MSNRLCIRIALIAVMGLIFTGSVQATPSLPWIDAQSQCSAHTSASEMRYGIPAKLLDAISIVESGRWDDVRRAAIAWPWTVSSGGDGKYFPTKAEAIAEVRRLKAKGVNNIDVGCMQVNLMYHPDAFVSLDEAFEPETNIGYAARFLRGLFSATNHWLTAASYYHSQTPSLAAEYRHRLEKIWSGGSTALASVLPPTQPQAPRPSQSRQVDELRAQWHARGNQSADEAKQIADAYRQARMAEYMLRHHRQIEAPQRIARAAP